MAHIPGGLRTHERESEDTTAGGFLVLIGNRVRVRRRVGGRGGRFWPRLPSSTRPAGRRNRSDKLKYQWSVVSVSGVYL